MKILNSFIWGIIAAAASLFSELVLFSILTINQAFEDMYANPGNQVSVLALPIILEEIFKIAAIRQNISIFGNKSKTFSRAFFIGIGFSFFEIIIVYVKFADKTADHLPEVFGIAVIHIITAVLSAIILRLLAQREKIGLILALLSATVVHLAYNLLIVNLA